MAWSNSISAALPSAGMTTLNQRCTLLRDSVR
jgi:hypothetical protein